MESQRLDLASPLLWEPPMRSAHPRPLVSLVLATRDRPERLARAVESVLGQSYENLELVVVNDGGAPVEGVLDALDRRDRIVHLRIPHRRGRAAARNHGLRVARGEYVGFLDDGDTLDAHHVATLVDALGRSEHLIGRALARRRIERAQGGARVVLREESPWPATPRAPTVATLLRDNPIPLASVLIHRRCLEELGAFDDALVVFEEWDLWLRIARGFPFLPVETVTSTVHLRLDELAEARIRERAVAARTILSRHADLVEGDDDVREAQTRLLASLERDAETHVPTCSIVVPFRSEHPGYVRGFLAQLTRTTRAFDVEVLVLDRGLAPAAAAEAAVVATRVLRVTGALSAVLREAASSARGEALVLVRSDVLLEDGWLQALARAAHDGRTIAGGLTLDPDGRVAHAGLAFEGQEASARPLYRRIEAQATELDLAREVEAIASATSWIPRNVARAVGFGTLDGWGALAELCLEARRRGARVRFVPESLAYRIPHGHEAPWLTAHELLQLAAAARGERLAEEAHDVQSRQGTEPPRSEGVDASSSGAGGRSPVAAA